MPKIFGYRGISNCSTINQTPVVTDSSGAQLIVEKQPFISMQSQYNVSTIRDYSTVANGGTISGPPTTGTGETSLTITTTSGSSAVLQTTVRCPYQAGYGSEVGLGVRIGPNFPANARARWGLFDGNDGFFFQYDTVNQLSCNVVRAGVISQTVQANFNTDILNGTGPSGYTFTPTNGVVYRIFYTYYGYGAIVFCLETPDANYNQQIIPIHQTGPMSGQSSVTTPYQPLRVELLSTAATANAVSLFLGGRQASIIGPYNPPIRTTGIFTSGGTYSSTGTNVLAFRRKVGWPGAYLKIVGIDGVFASAAFLSISVQASVTAGTWSTPPYHAASETALEYNSTFTGSTVGVTVYTCMTGGTLMMAGNDNLLIPMTETDIALITLTAKSGVGSQTITGMTVRIIENW